MDQLREIRQGLALTNILLVVLIFLVFPMASDVWVAMWNESGEYEQTETPVAEQTAEEVSEFPWFWMAIGLILIAGCAGFIWYRSNCSGAD